MSIRNWKLPTTLGALLLAGTLAGCAAGDYDYADGYYGEGYDGPDYSYYGDGVDYRYDDDYYDRYNRSYARGDFSGQWYDSDRDRVDDDGRWHWHDQDDEPDGRWHWHDYD